jgi:hypothetical protein
MGSTWDAARFGRVGRGVALGSLTCSAVGASFVVTGCLHTVLVCLVDCLVGDRGSCDIACAGVWCARHRFRFNG